MNVRMPRVHGLANPGATRPAKPGLSITFLSIEYVFTGLKAALQYQAAASGFLPKDTRHVTTRLGSHMLGPVPRPGWLPGAARIVATIADRHPAVGGGQGNIQIRTLLFPAPCKAWPPAAFFLGAAVGHFDPGTESTVGIGWT
jgi:hypothetical protein